MQRAIATAALLLSLLHGGVAHATPQTAKVLEDVKAAYAKQDRPMVVFDLEGTIFDNRPRILQILKEYADQELKTVRPDAAQKINALTPQLIQYMLADTLQ
jgi:hypothetical protein